MARVGPSVGFVFVLGLFAACGTKADDQATPVTCGKPADPGCRIAVHEDSFVRWTGPGTDKAAGGASTAVVRYGAGRFCMSGTVNPGADGLGWGVLLALGLDDVDEANRVIPSFDASALGVAQVRFRLETPPTPGVLLEITQIQGAACTQVPDCVTTFGRTGGLATSPGIFTVPLTDFNLPDTAHPNATLDRALMTGVHFHVPTSPGMAVDYAFCVTGLAFLDGDGRELRP